MKIDYSKYDFDRSLERIDEILNSSDYNYEEKKGIPSESSLTFKNGFYVDVTVVFVDIRGSKELANKHTRPVLAKIYRSYISEVIAVMKGNSKINDIFIEGDGVWAVFDTKTREDVQSVFSTTSKISSLIDALNKKLIRKGYSSIKVGIGMDDGESLYIKAGHNGSGINEIVWIGKVVGEAAKLSGFGNRESHDKRTMVTKKVYDMLSQHQKSLLKWNASRECYHGNTIWKPYEDLN
ncbi:adenylate/guanylate cyclase domain-containing protein [Nitratifractor salsuginis]|uniref:Adenylate/guanylate cyclase n=1 Tax=Nitratifractor salsuginis (strain DSM 16511 / JCM 12458 / E9I37-1) TaxID=749222 RepID=E6X1E0_NITSE|nr:adenylate/guanylate cyclase domain-containing protein [Nitratifractor salsuginis]ADV45873.1 putative adenylate/guanylate cyclase [Nitratifractor salsuginis DSM 16511]